MDNPLFADDSSEATTPLSRTSRGVSPSTLHEISLHTRKKLASSQSFNARGNFVHFAPYTIKNAVQLQDLMERPSLRTFLHRSKWYEKASMVRLRGIMKSNAVSMLSLVALVIALFFQDLFAFLAVAGDSEVDLLLTASFAFFVFECAANVISDKTYPFSFFFFMDLLGTLSMIFDISYMLGPDASTPQRLNDAKGGHTDGVIIVRAARAARIGARAGRLSRVAKIMRFFGAGSEEQEQHVKMAKVISNKLSDVLSIRIAFLVICVSVALPSFSMFEYPEMEESMTAWNDFLLDELHASGASVTSDANVALAKELRRFSAFYATSNYGPFMACYRKDSSDSIESFSEELLSCGVDDSFIRLPLVSNFTEPARGAFVTVTGAGSLQLFYDLSQPKRMEALMGMCLILFIIVVMIVFSTILAENISTVALIPLERMLAVVRQRCTQIFKYTNELEENEFSDGEEEDDENEDKQTNEFALLEKAVSKLGAIASISAAPSAVAETTEELTENDLMVSNWISGAAWGHDDTRLTRFFSGSTRKDRSLRQESEDEDLVRNIPIDIMSAIRTPFYDTDKGTPDQKLALTVFLLREHDGAKDALRRLPELKTVVRFATVAQKSYFPNPFHNFSHALDVLHTASVHMDFIQANNFLPSTVQAGLLVASLGHDLGHVGVNNQFLIETSHELALTYNDQSPLENLHCSMLFQILNSDESNIFENLKKDTYMSVRKEMIEAILHTDLTKHNEMVKELNLMYQMNSEAFESAENAVEALDLFKANRAKLVNALLHVADIGNPYKPWELAQKLAYQCMDEFFAQGDKEKELGIPVQMLNDREKVNRANSQIGFIEFMMMPFVEAMVLVFPQLDGIAFHIEKNIVCWAEQWQNEVQPQEDQAEKVWARVDKVASRCSSLLRDSEAKKQRQKNDD
eukprot:TRINITY_DN33706_c0_g1_i1.p1 TRINITY_DN33706_c0_g1~~TRINITY_DN33706_c0_g1_i1.p1  ORF type:complete len:919 (+),score=195.62 TRINITY_DN33706_c0_g1_i1:61-2817(+)